MVPWWAINVVTTSFFNAVMRIESNIIVTEFRLVIERSAAHMPRERRLPRKSCTSSWRGRNWLRRIVFCRPLSRKGIVRRREDGERCSLGLRRRAQAGANSWRAVEGWWRTGGSQKDRKGSVTSTCMMWHQHACSERKPWQWPNDNNIGYKCANTTGYEK